MVRHCRIVLIVLVALATNARAQSKSTPHKPVRKNPVAQPSKRVARPAAKPVDTPAVAAPVVVTAPPPPDTARKDTTAVGKLVVAAADSFVAQVKAPVVQLPVTPRSLIIPAVLFTYGAVTLNNGRLREINEEVQEVVWDGKKHTSPYLEDYALLAPALTVYALNIFGIRGQSNLIDRSVIYGLSNVVANGFTFGLKRVGIETRPDSSDNASFPSGHTAEAFVSAEFLHLEYRGRVHWSVIALGYVVGVGVGYLRMGHNKHWLSDVVAGAGVGIASTRFTYYIYPALKHLIFGSRKIKGDAVILPTYNNGMFGLAGVWRF